MPLLEEGVCWWEVPKMGGCILCSTKRVKKPGSLGYNYIPSRAKLQYRPLPHMLKFDKEERHKVRVLCPKNRAVISRE